MKRFNINNNIGVRLTEKGKETLRRKYPVGVEPDENGYYFLQMWEIMGIFGEFLQYPASVKETGLETVIIIKDEDLK